MQEEEQEIIGVAIVVYAVLFQIQIRFKWLWSGDIYYIFQYIR